MKGKTLVGLVLVLAVVAVIAGGAIFMLSQEPTAESVTELEGGGVISPATGFVCTDPEVEGELNFKQAGAAGTDTTNDLNAKVYVASEAVVRQAMENKAFGALGVDYKGEFALSSDNTIPFSFGDHFIIMVHDGQTNYYTKMLTSLDEEFIAKYGRNGTPCKNMILNGLTKKHGGADPSIYNEDDDKVTDAVNVPEISYDDSYTWKLKFDSNTQDAYFGADECTSYLIVDYNGVSSETFELSQGVSKGTPSGFSTQDSTNNFKDKAWELQLSLAEKIGSTGKITLVEGTKTSTTAEPRMDANASVMLVAGTMFEDSDGDWACQVFNPDGGAYLYNGVVGKLYRT